MYVHVVKISDGWHKSDPNPLVVSNVVSQLPDICHIVCHNLPFVLQVIVGRCQMFELYVFADGCK